MRMNCQNSRRNFLKTTMFGGAAAIAASKMPMAMAAPVAPVAAANSGPSRVSLAAGDDRAKIAFDSLTPFKKEIAAAIGNKRVVLKPNNVIVNVPLCASSADNLEGILEFLHSIGKTNIVIAESPANGTAMEGFANYGYDKLAAKYNVKLVNLDAEKYQIVYCIDQKDMQPHATRVATMMMDPANNYVISAAKLKTHDLVGITLSLKNVVVGAGIKDPGTGLRPTPGATRARSDKPLMHGGGVYGINFNLFMLSAKLHPDLAVIDGYEGMEGTGPVNGTAISQKVCIASTRLAGGRLRGRATDGRGLQQDRLPELLREGGRPGRERSEQDRDRWAGGEGVREDVSTAAAVGADFELVEAGGDGVRANADFHG